MLERKIILIIKDCHGLLFVCSRHAGSIECANNLHWHTHPKDVHTGLRLPLFTLLLNTTRNTCIAEPREAQGGAHKGWEDRREMK